ncbi:hypothetical protein QFZ31_006686 [Neobacillus niacini]|uniref:hypothetical protein n=1 Tax=Neobacillus driksii TaxID=3035913 RepID=UPI00278066E5|nr:hypothetical protein [Neobacillus niacini]MDQ0976634.1 hypothetical protein [Neobacillus niacini]
MRGHRRIKVTEDNGHIEETDLYLPNIKSIVGFLNGTWDFTMYDECFDGKSKLGDVDASIELFGHTMNIEFKRERTALTTGQIVKAIRQAKHSNITTFFVFGDTNRPVEYLRFSPNKLEGTGFHKCDTMILSKAFKQWNDYAKANDLTDRQDVDWVIAKRYMNAVGGGKK